MPSKTGIEANPAAEHTETSMAIPSSDKKPYLVFAAAPADGHTNPMIRIVAELIKRGFEATFIGGPDYEDRIRATGADMVQSGEFLSPEALAEREAVPPGMPRLLWDLKHIFIDQTPGRWQILKSLLERLRAEDSQREIVVVSETYYMGANPLSLGASLPKGFDTRPKVVDINVVPYIASSIDTGPPGPGLPPDATPSGRARNKLLNQMMETGPFAQSTERLNEIYKELGIEGVPVTGSLFDHWMFCHDVVLQMCPPSLEYPRSDMPSKVKFAGCMPPKTMPSTFVYPEWWDQITRGDRRVVTVTQGTIANIHSHLIIPTIKALSDREDILVVAILGKKGATLASDMTIPANTHVIDYLPYDAILPFTSVFVMNAGYGGFLHGVANGVPLVLAGETEDKLEVAMRGEWSGVAVNLRKGEPTVEEVKEGVELVLNDAKYKKRVEEIRKENAGMRVFDVIERAILA